MTKIPNNVKLEDASFTTLGAIALQGCRLSKPLIGETFLVVGLESPTTKIFNFFETAPKTFPPRFSVSVFASDLLIFLKLPVNITFVLLSFPFLFVTRRNLIPNTTAKKLTKICLKWKPEISIRLCKAIVESASSAIPPPQ